MLIHVLSSDANLRHRLRNGIYNPFSLDKRRDNGQIPTCDATISQLSVNAAADSQLMIRGRGHSHDRTTSSLSGQPHPSSRRLGYPYDASLAAVTTTATGSEGLAPVSVGPRENEKKEEERGRGTKALEGRECRYRSPSLGST
jgi:hypothetical protein